MCDTFFCPLDECVALVCRVPEVESERAESQYALAKRGLEFSEMSHQSACNDRVLFCQGAVGLRIFLFSSLASGLRLG